MLSQTSRRRGQRSCRYRTRGRAQAIPWSAWRDGDEPRAAPGPDGAWGKLSVKLTAGLTRINPGALCGQVAGAWRFEKPGFWLMAFRETWTPAAGRALVWHPLYSRHTPNQRAPFDRGNCGLSPPTGPPYSASPTTSQPETRATRHGRHSRRPAAPHLGSRRQRHASQSATAGRAVTARTRSEGWRPGRLHTWSWGRFRSCARANRKAAQDF